jgi:integrase
MSVYRPTPKSKTYVYDFRWRGQRYKDSTYQTSEAEAVLVESQKKLELRRQAAGLVPPAPTTTPRFSDFANITLAYQAQFIRRPDILERTLRMVLAFWGQRPPTPTKPAAVARPERVPRPYHNLRLGDPVSDPTWLERFEAWMKARGISGSARNSYLSACSDLYTCAMQPQYKATTGIAVNPFAGIRRSPQRTRVLALTAAQILALVDAAGRHIAVALCIAALAPKLRLASILALEWRQIDAGLTTITIVEHKTAGATGLPQVMPVSVQLREILLDVRAAQLREKDVLAGTRQPSAYVITYRRGRPVDSIKTGLRRAVRDVGLTWGLRDGVTFHTLRHSIATILANPDLVGALTERLRADVMGHREIRTTQKYTHLNMATQTGPHERLSAVLPLRALVSLKRRGESVGWKVGDPTTQESPKPEQIRESLAEAEPARRRHNR